MSDDTRGNGKEGSRPADDAALSARLRRLGEGLDRVGARQSARTEPASRSAADPSAIARGFRLSTELVAGVLGGALLGWLLDRWLGISPWGMIVFVLLGFAAGVVNVIRVAGAGGTGGTDLPPGKDDDEN
jgi:ATP synthase protein I